MQESPTPLSVLGPRADAERQRIRQQFEAGTSARDTLHAICELADNHVRQIFDEVLRVQNRQPEGLCLIALGGYGRRMLFPYSDLDILFLFGTDKTEQEFRPLIADSVVLMAINNGEVRPSDIIRAAGSCNLTDSGRKRFIAACAGRTRARR